MSECMPIPDNWKDFVKEYSFKDIREIYTNGSWLIPTFRVEQMMENFAKPDWISVNDKLPKLFENVLTYDSDGEIRINWLEEIGDGNPYFAYGGETVTHWMLLPEPPKESDIE